MNNLLKEKLSSIKLDYSTYGNLPIREDVVLIREINGNDEILKRWEKLNYLRKNLHTLDRYISGNKGEALKEWLVANKTGMSPPVMEKIGNHNNETGGISAYFFDLQNFFDEEEAIYDALEGKLKVSPETDPGTKRMREEREQKRKNRVVTRKKHLKDLKTDNKGYLILEIPEEEPVHMNADGPKEEPKKEEATKEQVEQVTEIKNKRGKVGIWIAGITLFVGVVYVATKGTKQE